MKRRIKWVFSPPSIKLNVLVVCEIIVLLTVSLGTLFIYARATLVKEAKMDAEQRLEGTVQRVDNILLGVEQASSNIYHDLLKHLDQPEQMQEYCHRLVQCNHNINGCVIAFKPGFFPSPDSLFRVYVRRDELKGMVSSPKFGHIPYTEQPWFRNTMRSGKATWMYPFQEQEEERVISFCLPITDKNGECVGVMAADLSVELFSQIILATKPTPNSYSVLLDKNGMFLIHPDKDKLLSHSVLTLADKLGSPSLKRAGEAVLAGGSGDLSFKLDGETWYIFYKPFLRNEIKGRTKYRHHWHIGTVYPKSDVFNEYNHHAIHVIVIIIAALLVFYVFSRYAIRKQMRPLRRLTESAYSIAEGNYATTIPDTERDDEVGMFQQNFKRMQETLLADIEKKNQLTSTLDERREKLRKAHEQIQEDDRVQTTFLHNVTNRMIPPSEAIYGSVTLLCDNYQHISRQEADKEVALIKEQSETILDLLSRKFDASYRSEAGKEEQS